MPGLSFSGEPKRGPFWWQIITEQKIQTCREPRIRPFKEGDSLFLYWKMRIPKAKKPIHYLGEATAETVKITKYLDFTKDDEFARIDGFVDHKELQEWFGEPTEMVGEGLWRSYRFTLRYTVVNWASSLVLSEEAERILKACKTHPDFPDYKSYIEIFGR